MTKEAWMERIRFILYGNDAWRILAVREGASGEMELTIDVHGRTVREARREIHNIVNCTLMPFRLNVIHGYNHGTAIKDMLSMESFQGRLEDRYCPAGNPGETVMRFAA